MSDLPHLAIRIVLFAAAWEIWICWSLDRKPCCNLNSIFGIEELCLLVIRRPQELGELSNWYFGSDRCGVPKKKRKEKKNAMSRDAVAAQPIISEFDSKETDKLF